MPRIDEFAIQKQEHSQWCWAAVTVSLHHYFLGETDLRQCGVVHRETDIPCCQDFQQTCNKPQRLESSLQRFGHLEGAPVAATLSFAEIRRKIDDGKLFCARVRWRDGGGHFVVVSGYELSPKGNRLIIDDPFYGQSIVNYDRFLKGYQVNHGTWTATFHLRKKRATVA